MQPVLTIQVIADDKAATKAIETARQLNAHLQVGDLNNSVAVAPYVQAGADVIRLSLNNDYSAVRNDLASRANTDWILRLEPWEFLAGGLDIVRKAMLGPPAIYSMPTVTQDVMVKESRLWHRATGAMFVNPVFETLDRDGDYLEVPVVGKPPNRTEEQLRLLNYWKSIDPIDWSPYYFQACVLLSQRKYDEFLTVANHYLFRDNGQSLPEGMLRYYQALVLCLIKKNMKDGLKPLLTCLGRRPMMAEYWCLLGDVYYQQNRYEKARHLYENAMIMGSRRLRTDAWPMEISKYKSYPHKMIAACDRVLAETKIITAQRSQ